MDSRKLASDAEIEACARRIVVEVFGLAAKKNPSEEG